MLSQKEVREGLYNSLKEIGLSEASINLYTLSLTQGPTSLSELANILEISRPNIYKLVNELKALGLAKFSGKERYSKSFVVESPNIVRDLIQKRREQFSSLDKQVGSLLPDLLTLYRQGSLPSSVRVMEGKELFEKAFFEIIEETKDRTEFFGSAEDFVGFISWEKEREWIRRRMEKKIFVRSLLLPSKTAEILKPDDSNELREIRILKNVDPFLVSFQLFANKVIIWQPKVPMAVFIADEYIVQMLRSVFYALWEQSA